MSKRGSVRARRDERRKQTRQSQVIIAGIGVVALVGVVFLLLSGRGQSAPEVVSSRLDLDPVMGNPDAPVTIIEYGAYACPACRAWHQAGIVEQILQAYPDQVKFVFRDFPVISPAYDRMAANVAQCALDQGEDKYWAVHNALYSTVQPGSSQDSLIVLGIQLGLDGTALRTCAEAGTHLATVEYDENRARALNLPGTPSFLVNGNRLFNADPAALQAAVEQALNA